MHHYSVLVLRLRYTERELTRLTHKAGYTVGELIVGMAIAASLAGTAAPMASALLNQHRLVTTARRLGFEIARARMEAVGQNVFVRIALVGTGQYKRERSADSGATWVGEEPPISLPTGFTLAAGDTGTPRFDRQGMAQASTRITVSGPSGQLTVAVNVLGRVTTS